MPLSQADKAARFTSLHVKGTPVVIYNVWDGGSAKAVLSAGAKAIATGDHPVGYAHGFGDDNFDDFTFETYLKTIQEIAAVAGDAPFSVDISNAPGLDEAALAARIAQVIQAGAVGINFEDRLSDSSGVATVEDHTARLRTIRQAAQQADVPLHINARCDLFSTSQPGEHAGKLDEAVARAEAYARAGADSFFAPLLADPVLIKQLCDRAELPVNIIRLSEDVPTTRELAAMGVARVSYGPRPQMETMRWLSEQAKAALAA